MIIEAKNINHFYEFEHVLHNIDLVFESGKITAIVGESGSGKSTLLSILSTLLKPTSGDVFYDKQNVKEISNVNTFRRDNIGFIFQFHYLIDYLNVKENIALAAKSDEQINELLINLGIDRLANRYSNEISGGERQRAAIARALVNFPSMVFADEPTGNLDVKNAITVFELFKKFKETGFVVATHDKKIIDYADVLIEMEDGFVKNISNTRN
jgi:ABC-type lipoprotein export system ATPase subunit